MLFTVQMIVKPFRVQMVWRSALFSQRTQRRGCRQDHQTCDSVSVCALMPLIYTSSHSNYLIPVVARHFEDNVSEWVGEGFSDWVRERVMEIIVIPYQRLFWGITRYNSSSPFLNIQVWKLRVIQPTPPPVPWPSSVSATSLSTTTTTSLRSTDEKAA